MTTYFQAVQAVKVFTEYRRLTVEYWQAQPADSRRWTGRDLPAPESDESRTVRQQIVHLFPVANTCAKRIGISVMAQSYPAPAVGGPVVPINMLLAVVDRDQGHSRLPKQKIMDVIDQCLAQAIALKKHLYWRQLVNPVWWITEAAAYVLRIPFIILRRAGVPDKVEESVWGYAVKVVMFLVMILIGLRYGLNLSAKDLLGWIK